jgi:signal transduction histidine kinase
MAPTPAVLHTPSGVTWIGTGDGLLRYEAGKANWFGRKEGLELPDVRAVVQARDGTVWFGMLGGGLGRLSNDGTLCQFRKRDGLSSDFVQCLRLDSDGTLWIGTFGGGLNRLKRDRFAAINTSQGLANNVIHHIEEDARGFFWLSSHGGVMRVSKAGLNLCADGETNTVTCLSYGKGEGLPTLECSGGCQPAGARTADGRLWFPTTKGLVGVDPNDVKVNQLPPPVVVEEMLVEDKPVTLDARDMRIPPGRKRFEFRYTGLSFTVPEKVRFQYRLEGLEPEWVVAGTKRVANYSYIPPGDYKFRVKACNNDGVWSPEGALLAFKVLPQFWQTLWFRILATLAAMSAVAGSVLFETRRRMHRKLERLEQQRGIERERTRIAKDIHDDLGASLTRITLLSQSARSELENPSQAAADLDRIYGTARELTRAMDEIVWAVNPKHDTLDSLASYLGRFAQDFLGAAGIRCRLRMPLELPPWPLSAEVRHNLFLAFKESLHNAVKHAAATEVQISLKVEPSNFVLSVKDNGCGFLLESPAAQSPPDPSRPAGGNGLVNMRQRLKEIGGECEIKSAPRAGTNVTFACR